MPNAALSDALKEAYATAPSNILYLDTLAIAHPLADTLYLVKDRVDHFLKLETGEVVQFLPTGFRFVLPAAGDNGLQELSIAVDNVDRRPSDFINLVRESAEPVTVTYRPYLSTNPEGPEMNPPLVLFLTDIVVTSVEITGRATFADILNRSYLSENYTRRRFPGL